MKKFIMVLLSALLIMTMLLGCNSAANSSAKGNLPDASNEASKEVTPINYVQSEDDFNALGIKLTAPDNSDIDEMSIQFEEIASIKLTYKEKAYMLRGGINDDWQHIAGLEGPTLTTPASTGEIKDNIKYDIYTYGQGRKVLTWKLEGITYALLSFDEVEDNILCEMTANIISKIQNS